MLMLEILFSGVSGSSIYQRSAYISREDGTEPVGPCMYLYSHCLFEHVYIFFSS